MLKEKDFQKTAELLLQKYLRITKDKLLIIKDHESKIVTALENAAKKNNISCKTVSITINRKASSPIPEILESMLLSDAIIAPTQNSTTHSPETKQATLAGKKIITLPGITEELFVKIGKANVLEIDSLNAKVKEVLSKADKIRVTTKSGTNISFSIKNRPVKSDGTPPIGKGFVQNMPCGETFCAPIEESANGIIFIDYWRTKITPKDKAWIEVRSGKIVAHSDTATPYVKELNVPNGTIIAEFGIGTNKAHKKPIGNILHDEKIYGTVHIAFGMNKGFGGQNESSVHIDVILQKPTINVDGKVLKI